MFIAFSGRIASGKSVVSTAVAEHYSLDRVSFGDAVRNEARRRGLDADRRTLQELGDELIAAGWTAFCSLVLRQVAWDGQHSLVVDGVRHIGACDALRNCAPARRFSLVFVDAPWERRMAWLSERGVTDADAVAADHHPNEGEMGALMREADVIVVNDGDLERVVADVIAWIDESGGAEEPAAGVVR